MFVNHKMLRLHNTDEFYIILVEFIIENKQYLHKRNLYSLNFKNNILIVNTIYMPIKCDISTFRRYYFNSKLKKYIIKKLYRYRQ